MKKLTFLQHIPLKLLLFFLAAIVEVKMDQRAKRCFEFTDSWLYTPGHPDDTTITIPTCTNQDNVILVKSAIYMRPEEIGDGCFGKCCQPTMNTCTADIETNFPNIFHGIQSQCNGKSACDIVLKAVPMDTVCGKSSSGAQMCNSFLRDQVLIAQPNSDETELELKKYYDFWCWSRKVEIIYECVDPSQVPPPIEVITQPIELTTSPETTTIITQPTTILPTLTSTLTTSTPTPSSTTLTPEQSTTTTVETTTTTSVAPSSTTTVIPPPSSTTTIAETDPISSSTEKSTSSIFVVELDKITTNSEKVQPAELKPDILPPTILPSTLSIISEDIPLVDGSDSKLPLGKVSSTVKATLAKETDSILLEEDKLVYVNVQDVDLEPTKPQKKDSNTKFIAIVAGATVLALIAICAVTIVIHILLRRRTSKVVRKSSLKQPTRDNAAIMKTMNTLRRRENSCSFEDGTPVHVPVTNDLVTFDRNSRLGSLSFDRNSRIGSLSRHSQQGCSRQSYNGCDMVDNTYYEAEDVTMAFPPPCHPDQKQIINDIILNNYTIKQPPQKMEPPTADHVYYELCEDAATANQDRRNIYNPTNQKVGDSEDYYESSDDYQSSKSSDDNRRRGLNNNQGSVRVNMQNYSGDDDDYYESSEDEQQQPRKLSQVKNVPVKPRSVQQPSKSSDYDYAYDHFEFEGRVRAK